MKSEYYKRIIQKEAQEQKMRDFTRALTLYYEYTKSKMEIAKARPFIFVGEVMHTEKGKFRIEDWNFAFNDKIQEIDSIYTLDNYTTGSKVMVWFSDLNKNYELSKMVFINFKL